MGVSRKSHGKKSDKETQSPMLKIFKDIMQKEKTNDPEKVTLLKEKHDRPKRHYSGSRTKPGHKTTATGSSEKMRKQSYNKLNENYDFDSKTQSFPFQGEKRESWWFRKDADVKPLPDEDTCSCVSCALFTKKGPRKSRKKKYKIKEKKEKIGEKWVTEKSITEKSTHEKKTPEKCSVETNTSQIVYCQENDYLRNDSGSKTAFSDWESLKKLITSDHACVACLVVLFIVSVLGTVCLLYNSIPCLNGDSHHVKTTTPHPTSAFDRYKRKIHEIGGKLNFDPLVTNFWDHKVSKSYEPSFDTLAYENNMNLESSEADLTKMLDLKQMNNIQGNSRLREFYRKLIETDIAIRNLKRNIPYYGYTSEFLENQDRFKRSILQKPFKLLHLKRKSKDKKKLVTKTTINMSRKNTATQSSRGKRNGGSSIPESFMIEKNKVVIQYQPYSNRIVPKCSHVPKDPMSQKSHETQLNHPFYKNTQRLDELLDQVLEKKIPDIMSDQFGLDLINKNGQNEQTINKNDQNEQTTDEDLKNKEDDTTVKDKEMKDLKVEETKATESAFENDFFDDSDGVDRKGDGKSSYDLLLSIATIINPAPNKKSDSLTTPTVKRAPNMRKLLEVDAKEDGGPVKYDDKDLLDDKKTDEKTDTEKKKEDNLKTVESTNLKVNNPNWKGPMPLYPEELNSLKTSSLVHIPVINHIAPKRDEVEMEMNDVEYVEDYLDNTFDKLAKLAQAYSDYGVLNEKKDSDSEKKVDRDYKKAADRTRLSIGNLKNKLRKSGLFLQSRERSKKGQPHESFDSRMHKSPSAHWWITGEQITTPTVDYASLVLPVSSPISIDPITFPTLPKLTNTAEDARAEGFKIEYRTPPNGELKGSDLYKMLQKHIKFTNTNEHDEIGQEHSHNERLGYAPTISPASEKTKALEFNAYHQLAMVKTSKTPTPELNLNKNSKKVKHPKESLLFKVKRNLQSVNDACKGDYNRIGTTKFDVISENNNVEHRVLMLKRDANLSANNAVEEVKDLKQKYTSKATSKKVAERGKKMANATGNLTMSEFFSMLSHWFSSLDGFDFSKKSTVASITEDTLSPIHYINQAKVTEPAIPYDSDMIDNTGHRSRVLLSVDDDNATMDQQLDDLLKTDDFYDSVNIDKSDDKTLSMDSPTTSSTTPIGTANNRIENNTKVRKQRQASDSLIFWNDLYDEEYGIQVDPLESTVRDKHSAKDKPNWLQNKVRIITDKIGKKKSAFGSDVVGLEGEDFDDDDNGRRNRRLADDSWPQKTNFAALTAKMKEVCRDTVKAVEQMKSDSEKETSKDAKQASSLMQHLVRLMGDLVDFQVQERTCKALPPDLQKFLEWLTSAGQDSEDEPHFEFEQKEKLSDADAIVNEVTKEDPVARSDCLGTLQALQDLMREYDDLTDDDKSLMVGVKDYLQHQKTFLERRLSGIYDNDMYNMNLPRFKRELPIVLQSTQKMFDNAYFTVKNEYKKINKAYHKYKDKLHHYSDVHNSNKFKALKAKSMQVTKTFGHFYDSRMQKFLHSKKLHKDKHTKPANLKNNVLHKKIKNKGLKYRKLTDKHDNKPKIEEKSHIENSNMKVTSDSKGSKEVNNKEIDIERNHNLAKMLENKFKVGKQKGTQANVFDINIIGQ